MISVLYLFQNRLKISCSDNSVLPARAVALRQHHEPSSVLQCTDVFTTKHRSIRADCCVQTSPVVSDYVPQVAACWLYHTINVEHLAVGHSQSPDPLSGTCFQTNSETLTAMSLHSGSHWRHSSLTSISVLQRIRGVYDYVLYKSTFYLLTYPYSSTAGRSETLQSWFLGYPGKCFCFSGEKGRRLTEAFT